MTTTTTASVKAQRTYNEWRIVLVSIGQTYGIGSYQWRVTLEAAYPDLLFRVWSLQDEAETAIRSVKR
jgi:hypothetical protein